MMPLLKRKKKKALIPHSLLMQGKRIIHPLHSLPLSDFSSFNIQNNCYTLFDPPNSQFSSFSIPAENTDHLCAYQICRSNMLLLMCHFSLVDCHHLNNWVGGGAPVLCFLLTPSTYHKCTAYSKHSIWD